MQLGLRFNGELDFAALEAALNEICRRHEVFRTRFQSVDGDPIQIISPPEIFALDRLDLSTSYADPFEEVTRLARAEAQRPFDLTVAPVVRFSLFQTAEREHVLLMTMHHIISDGWSLSVFLGELSVLYSSYHQHKESPLPELPIQYSDSRALAKRLAARRRPQTTSRLLEETARRDSADARPYALIGRGSPGR